MDIQRYFIEISYKGTNYHGWQFQPNATSVQGTLEDGLSKLLHQRVSCVGAGRTDTGVHARNYWAHFDVSDAIDCSLVMYRINRFLPRDIAVHRIVPVPIKTHSRFDALSRTYHYRINYFKSAFDFEFSYFYPHHLDVALMNEACAIMMEYTDFESFSKTGSDNKTSLCKLMQAQWTQNGNDLLFVVQADRFLRNMVRAIVGAMLKIGEYKLSLDEFRTLIEQKKRSPSIISAVPQGLCLVNVEYPEHINKYLFA